MKHPETYPLTREEWSLLNQALCGARLACGFKDRDRRDKLGKALDVISEVYERGAKQEGLR